MKETSFHTLPADKKVADVWIKVINRTELPKQLFLYSEHFAESCFDRSHELRLKYILGKLKPSRKLLSGSIPTIFPH